LYTSTSFRFLRKSSLAASNASSIGSWADIAATESLSNEKYSVPLRYITIESGQEEYVDSLLNVSQSIENKMGTLILMAGKQN
jgi:hypothetical protein